MADRDYHLNNECVTCKCVYCIPITNTSLNILDREKKSHPTCT